MIAAFYERKSTEQLGTDDEQKPVARQIESARARRTLSTPALNLGQRSDPDVIVAVYVDAQAGGWPLDNPRVEWTRIDRA